MPLGLVNLPSRAGYLEANNEPIGDRPDGGRWMIINVWKLNDNRVPKDLAADPLLFYADFLFRSTNKSDRERVQIFPSSEDNGKAYFFDREIRQYSIQGFVYDVKYDSQQEANGLVSDGLTTFKRLYENMFRMSAAARQGLLVELDCDDFRIWGAMTSMIATHTSDTPSLFVITFGFWAEAVEVKDTFKVTGNLHISQESAVKIGLVEEGKSAIVVPIGKGTPGALSAAARSGIEGRIRNANSTSDAGSRDTAVVHPEAPQLSRVRGL